MSTPELFHRPEYGPFQIGRDYVAEIVSTVRDIAALRPDLQHEPLKVLVSTYNAAQFADALLCVANGMYSLDNSVKSDTVTR